MRELNTGSPRLHVIVRQLLFWITLLAIVAVSAQTVMDLMDLRLVTRGTMGKDARTWTVTRKLERPVYEAYISGVFVAPDLQDKLPPGVHDGGMIYVSADYASSDTRARILRLLASVPGDLIWIGIVWLLRSMLLSTFTGRSGDVRPFITQNVWRLRGVAALLVLLNLYYVWVVDLKFQLVERTAMKDIAAFSWEYSYIPLETAFLLFMLSEVFAYGVRLQHDVEGLV